VPSPEPIEIAELEVIRDLFDRGVLVIACGGGGIPVIWKDGRLEGVEAVIDKDRAAALLALALGIDLFVISTDTDYVYTDYKKPGQSALRQVSASDLEAHFRAGHFPPGNMGPKVESVLRFLRGCSGGQAIITSCENLRNAVSGSAGTHVFTDRECANFVLHAQLELPVGEH
jgi:carbamate kinase